MKSLYLIAVLCGIWMSVDGSVLECFVKIQEERPNIVGDVMDLIDPVQHIFEQINNNMKNRNLRESLNTEISNVCYPAKIEERLYPVVIEILEVCEGKEHLFTEKGKKMAESLLKHLFCDVFMKLAVSGNSLWLDDCFRDQSTLLGISSCSQGSINAFKEWIYHQNTGRCTVQSKTSTCINQLMKEKCSAGTANFIESLLLDVQNLLGCGSGANTNVILTTSGSFLFEILTLDSNIWGSSSTTVLKENCMSKVQNDGDLFREITNLNYTLMSGLKNITENLSMQNSVGSLDSKVNDVCLPVVRNDNLYSLGMRLLNMCISQEEIFTEVGKQLLKSLIERFACNIPMKVAALGTFVTYDHCYFNLVELKSRCGFFDDKSGNPTLRYKFSGDNMMCPDLSSMADCINGVVKNTCPASVSETLEFLSVEVLNFVSECHFSIDPLKVLQS